MASLPAPGPASGHSATFKHPIATLQEAQLRDFAREDLGAQRMSAAYLQALRVVLGRQAQAERAGTPLVMNIRTDFTTERVMRTIINQMKAAGITQDKRVGLGGGRVQVVQVFTPTRAERLDLCTLMRLEESRADADHGHTAFFPVSVSDVAMPY